MAKAKRPPRKLESVITYLEMREEPRRVEHLPPAHKHALMRAEHPTVSFYRYLYSTVGEPWLWWERRAMDDETLTAIIHDEKVEVYVFYVDGVPAGFAELDRREESDIELAYFGLIPDFIGMGYGTYLMTWIVDAAWRYKPARLWVHSCNFDHPKAIQTYQHAGFEPYDQEIEVIDDPRDLGLIPRHVKFPVE